MDEPEATSTKKGDESKVGTLVYRWPKRGKYELDYEYWIAELLKMWIWWDDGFIRRPDKASETNIIFNKLNEFLDS